MKPELYYIKNLNGIKRIHNKFLRSPSKAVSPLLAKHYELVQFYQNFDFKIRRDHRKKFL